MKSKRPILFCVLVLQGAAFADYDYFYGIFARGDKPGGWSDYRDGMPVAYIDPNQWGYDPVEAGLGNMQSRAYLHLKILIADKPAFVAGMVPNLNIDDPRNYTMIGDSERVYPDSIKNVYRACRKIISFDTLAEDLGIDSIKNMVHTNRKMPVYDYTHVPKPLLRTSLKLNPPVEDVATIAAGDYTVGAGGGYDYLLWSTFFADFAATFTGNMTGTLQTTVTDNAQARITENMAGHRLYLLNGSPHGGDMTAGNRSIWSSADDVHCFNFDNTGALSKIVIRDQIIIKASGGGASHGIFAQEAVNCSLEIRNNFVNSLVASADTKYGININTSAPACIVNNIVAGKWLYGFSFTLGAATTDVQNNTVFACSLYAFNANSRAINLVNNVGDSLIDKVNGLCYRLDANATRRCNAAEDATASGVLPIDNIASSDEYLSMDSTAANFLKIRKGGNLWNQGFAGLDACNTTGIRANPRPGNDMLYSIGADECATPENVGIVPAYTVPGRLYNNTYGQSAGISAWYKCNVADTTGRTLQDQSAGNLDGVMGGGCIVHADSGYFGGGLIANGLNDSMVVQDLADIMTNVFSYNMRFKMLSQGQANSGVLLWNNTLTNLGFYYAGAGYYWCQLGINTSRIPVSLKQWHHVSATRGADDTMRVYTNGYLSTKQKNTYDALGRQIVMNRIGGDLAFDGNVDDHSYYDKVLTHKEISTWALAGVETYRGVDTSTSGMVYSDTSGTLCDSILISNSTDTLHLVKNANIFDINSLFAKETTYLDSALDTIPMNEKWNHAFIGQYSAYGYNYSAAGGEPIRKYAGRICSAYTAYASDTENVIIFIQGGQTDYTDSTVATMVNSRLSTIDSLCDFIDNDRAHVVWLGHCSTTVAAWRDTARALEGAFGHKVDSLTHAVKKRFNFHYWPGSNDSLYDIILADALHPGQWGYVQWINLIQDSIQKYFPVGKVITSGQSFMTPMYSYYSFQKMLDDESVVARQSRVILKDRILTETSRDTFDVWTTAVTGSGDQTSYIMDFYSYSAETYDSDTIFIYFDTTCLSLDSLKIDSIGVLGGDTTFITSDTTPPATDTMITGAGDSVSLVISACTGDTTARDTFFFFIEDGKEKLFYRNSPYHMENIYKNKPYKNRPLGLIPGIREKCRLTPNCPVLQCIAFRKRHAGNIRTNAGYC